MYILEFPTKPGHYLPHISQIKIYKQLRPSHPTAYLTSCFRLTQLLSSTLLNCFRLPYPTAFAYLSFPWTCLINDDVLAEPVDLGEEEVHILLSDGSGADDVPEEVGAAVVGLVADHDGTGLHHLAFQFGAHLWEITSCTQTFM